MNLIKAEEFLIKFAGRWSLHCYSMTKVQAGDGYDRAT